jgi:hypothetical protein
MGDISLPFGSGGMNLREMLNIMATKPNFENRSVMTITWIN